MISKWDEKLTFQNLLQKQNSSHLKNIDEKLSMALKAVLDVMREHQLIVPDFANPDKSQLTRFLRLFYQLIQSTVIS